MGRYAGLSFPLRITAGGAPAVSQDRESVRDGLRNVLSTRPGERYMRTSWGTDLDAYVFANRTSLLDLGFPSEIRRAIEMAEPRVTVLDVRVEEDAVQDGLVHVDIEYEINGQRDLLQVDMDREA